jgi:hypothetical protein
MLLKLLFFIFALFIAFIVTLILGIFFFGRGQLLVWKRELEKRTKPQNSSDYVSKKGDKGSVEVQYQVIKEEEI